MQTFPTRNELSSEQIERLQQKLASKNNIKVVSTRKGKGILLNC
jgi:hypothetical protein